MNNPTLNSTPYGFSPEPWDVLVRAGGNSTSIAAGDLVIFDFLNGTNDPYRAADAGASYPAANGFQTVRPYLAGTHYGQPGVYGVALEAITTNSSGVPTAYGRVRIRGYAYVKAEATTGVTKGKPVMPSLATDGCVTLKPASSASLAEAQVCACIGLGLADISAGAYGYILFDGFAFNGNAKD